jgi:cytochrome c peroxidase
MTPTRTTGSFRSTRAWRDKDRTWSATHCAHQARKNISITRWGAAARRYRARWRAGHLRQWGYAVQTPPCPPDATPFELQRSRRRPGRAERRLWRTLTHANFVLTTLQRQALVPLFGEDPVEHGLSGRDAILLERLRAEPRYQLLFSAAFPEGWTLHSVVLALATFQRGLVSARSAYDEHLAGDDGDFSEAAARGEQAFRARGCPDCHGGFFFSSAMARDGSQAPRFERSPARQDVAGGIELLTGRDEDRGRFKPLSLRNVALAAPYFHDGTTATLDAVLAAYGVAVDDRPDLLAFFESLSDYALLEDPRFADPWR